MIVRFLLLLMLLAWSGLAAAAPIATHVPEFRVTGTAAKDDLKQALQSLLSSRLAGENVRLVSASDSPELSVIGTYIMFGKVFSLDAQIVAKNGKILGRAFEQGESSDDVIPAIGRLADKLNSELAKMAGAGTPEIAQPAALPVVIRPPQTEKQKVEGDIIRPEGLTKGSESGMIGQRLDGIMIGIVQLKAAEPGKRKLVIALERELRIYAQDKELQLLETESNFKSGEQILAIDVDDLDQDGIEELYVTILQSEEPVSRVYLIEKGKFRQIAASLPYFFRSIRTQAGTNRIHAQQMGRDEDFYGDLYELVKKGALFETVNPVKLPRPCNIFNVNRLNGKDGKPLFVALNSSGYIVVYDEKGEDLWKSSDKFGGSEAYFSRDNLQHIRITGSPYRKVFLEQRIIVTKAGHIIVPKNEGTFVLGDSRSFTRNHVYAFAWNGASLDELWHTKLSQNYLADYLYDEDQKELVLLEIVKKAGIIAKGASAVSVKRVE